VLAHVAGIPVEEALLAAPALLAGVTVIAGYVRATAARPRRGIRPCPQCTSQAAVIHGREAPASIGGSRLSPDPPIG
jgi:hypothetical protein